jgi:hypothetical protein
MGRVLERVLRLIAKADELNLGAQKYKKLEKYAWIMILVAFGFFGLELWADIRLPYVIYTGMLVLGSIGIISVKRYSLCNNYRPTVPSQIY